MVYAQRKMSSWKTRWGRLLAIPLLIVVAGLLSRNALALTPEVSLAIASGEVDARIAALNKAVIDADVTLATFVDQLLADEVKIAAGKVFLVKGDKTTDVAGAAAKLPDGAEDVVNNNRMRSELEAAKAALGLFSPEQAVRVKALKELKDKIDESKLRESLCL
jgi:urea transport system permease protein